MLAFGAPPFHSAVNTDSFYSFLALQPGNSNFFRFHPHTRSLFSSKKIPQSFMDLLLKMLMVKPGDRVQEAADLLNFAFFTEQSTMQEHEEDRDEEESTTKLCHTDMMKYALTELINDMEGNQEDWATKLKHKDWSNESKIEYCASKGISVYIVWTY